MVVAAEAFWCEAALAVDGASEFASPDDEGVIEETSLFEVGDESGGGLVGFLATLGELAAEAAVGVPAAVEELHEADAAFAEAAGHEGVVGVGAGLPCILAVEFEGAVWLAGNVGEFRHGHLHAEGHLVLRDTGLDFGIVEFLMVDLVECAEVIERFAAEIAADALGIVEIEDGVFAGTKADALVFRGKKARAPESVVKGLAGAVRSHRDEGGEIGVFTAEPVGKPGADGGASGELETGLEEGDGGVVVDGLGVHRADHADVIGNTREMREEIGIEPLSALPGLFEIESGLGDRERGLPGGHAGEALAVEDGSGDFLAMVFFELGLGIKEIHLRGPPALEKIDDAFGFYGQRGWVCAREKRG